MTLVAAKNHLLMDAGNTSLKISFEDQLSDNKTRRLMHGSYEIGQELDQVHQQSEIQQVSLSSVYQLELTDMVKNWCSSNKVRFLLAVSQESFGGLVNAYSQPEMLGVDRWLGMIALWQKYKRAFFVVSCGTAVTIDAVADDGRHLGGVIVPGPALMKQSLLDNAATIKEINGLILVKNSLADNTRDAITTGTWTAVAALIEKMMISNSYKTTQGYLTGGCASKLAEIVEPDFTVEPDLVLAGLSVYASRVMK